MTKNLAEGERATSVRTLGLSIGGRLLKLDL